MIVFTIIIIDCRCVDVEKDIDMDRIIRLPIFKLSSNDDDKHETFPTVVTVKCIK